MKKDDKTLDVERGKRVAQLRAYLHLSQEKFASLIGVTQGAVTKMEKGGDSTLFYQLAKKTSIPIAWLMDGAEAAPWENKEDTPEGFAPIIDWRFVRDFVRGHTSYAVGADTQYVQVPVIAPPYTHPYPTNLFALKVQGDAMVGQAKAFTDGSIIIVDPSRPAKHGHYVVAGEAGLIPKGFMFRKLTEDGGTRALAPLNSAYQAKEIGDSYEIYGVVIAHVDILV